MSLLDAEPRSATLVPQEPSILLGLDPDSFDAMLAAGNVALLRLMLNVLQQQVGRMRHLIDGRSADPFTDHSGVVKCGLGGTTYSLAFRRSAFRGTCPPKRRCGTILSQVRLADRLGFGPRGSAARTFHWPSTSVQRMHRPCLTFRAEVCLNTDIVQLATWRYAATSRIGVGSAIQSIFTNGGPIVQAEALGTFLTLKTLGPWKHRRLNFGFGTGRFDFVLEAHGMTPRTEAERLVWPVVKRRAFLEATELFLRLLKGESPGLIDLSGADADRSRSAGRRHVAALP